MTALGNNNFVIASPEEREGGVAEVGSVRLVNGTTGVEIGTPLFGDTASDELGDAGCTALPSNNFVVVSRIDDDGAVVDAGTLRLVNGTTGVQIGATLAGDTADDMSLAAVITGPADAFFVAAFQNWDNGSVDSGRVRLVAE